MNAQRAWKRNYRLRNKFPTYNFSLSRSRYRREAALERALAAANRRIEELEALLTGMSRMVEQRDRILSDHDARLLEQWHERM